MDVAINIDTLFLNNFLEGIYVVDANRKFLYWNEVAERITGFKSTEIVGKYCYNNLLNHMDEYENMLCLDGCPLHETIKDGQIREARVFLQHKFGHRVSVIVKTIPIYNNNEIVGAIEAFVENTESYKMSEQINDLTQLALYDQLTKLPNRRYIDSFLRNRLDELKGLNIPFAVTMIDIDNFKYVNDTYGHDTGDEVLKMVSRTMSSVYRNNDLVGRWGGEEFLAITTGVSDYDLERIIEKVRVLVQKSVMRNNGIEISVTISLGATVANNDDTIDTIIKRADEALYMSKNNGKNRYTIK